MSLRTGRPATEVAFRKVLVANRGAVAAKILRILRGMGIPSVAVYSEADRDAPYLAQADEAVCIGPAPARESYLDIPALLEVVSRLNVDAVHPGYGFLAESPEFAQRLSEQGVTFIGPSPKWLHAMGHKTNARQFFAEHGLAVGDGSAVLGEDESDWIAAANHIGYPVLVKPAEGGGGIGMVRADTDEALVAAVAKSRSIASRSFGAADVYIERFIEHPRHIEFQVLADNYHNAVHVFERDCSVQRRHQKVLEEAPAPGISREDIAKVADAITELLARVGYNNIGTVEMLWAQDGTFSFLEMNTRLQVEHGVTELAYGVDIVEAQIRLAAGARLDAIFPADFAAPRCHAIEARVYAEDPQRNFFPSTGTLTIFNPPPESDQIRVETGYAQGQAVTPFYDPMIAKVIASGCDRKGAIAALRTALSSFEVEGIKTNLGALDRILGNEAYQAGMLHTRLMDDIFSLKS